MRFSGITAIWQVWDKRRCFMYQYVESNEVKRYRSYCSKVLEDVRDDLYDSFGVNTNFSLVGSG